MQGECLPGQSSQEESEIRGKTRNLYAEKRGSNKL